MQLLLEPELRADDEVVHGAPWDFGLHVGLLLLLLHAFVRLKMTMVGC